MFIHNQNVVSHFWIRISIRNFRNFPMLSLHRTNLPPARSVSAATLMCKDMDIFRETCYFHKMDVILIQYTVSDLCLFYGVDEAACDLYFVVILLHFIFVRFLFYLSFSLEFICCAVSVTGHLTVGKITELLLLLLLLLLLF